MLRTFLPLLVMTFCICWFIVLMQFLWKYVDDLSGKGLSIDILAQTFFYAALNLVPMAMPLGILLASLMTFGNLGERFELLSMKSAGISLYRIMAPLLVSVFLLALGLLWFQNNEITKAQVKLYTIIYSARNTSPELEIPEATFYNGIPGYNVFVQKKDRKTHMLYKLMINDHSAGFQNASIIRADSGKLTMDETKTFLTLELYNGRSFRLMQAQTYSLGDSPVPVFDELFKWKKIVIPFDTNFKMEDEDDLKSSYAGKDIAQLSKVIDSTRNNVDSIRHQFGRYTIKRYEQDRFAGTPLASVELLPGQKKQHDKLWKEAAKRPISFEEKWNELTPDAKRQALTEATTRLDYLRSDMMSKTVDLQYELRRYRSYSKERYSRFAFPIACLIFFFIGAPLGSIVRKGGLGVPIVLSVALFLVYYMVDTFGSKMATSGEWPIWMGVSLSTAVLLPIGIYLSIMAAKDSATLNIDAYLLFFKKLFKADQVRKIEFKEIIMEEADPYIALDALKEIKSMAQSIKESKIMKGSAVSIWLHSADQSLMAKLSSKLDNTVEYLYDCSDLLVRSKLADYPIFPKRISGYLPSKAYLVPLSLIVLPISLPMTFYFGVKRKRIARQLQAVLNVSDEIEERLNKLIEAHNKQNL